MAGGERMKVILHTSTDDISNVAKFVRKAQEIEEAHSVNCVLHVEVFKRTDLLNCSCDSCEPSDS